MNYLAQLDPLLHDVLLHLHLASISANGAALAHHLLALLDEKFLFEAGWAGVEWQSFAEAARAALPNLEPGDQRRVEHVILGRRAELDWAKRLVRDPPLYLDSTPEAQHRRLLGAIASSGREQWQLLETIGDDNLSSSARLRLNELRRKFVRTESSELRRHRLIEGDNAILMKDCHWLRAINKYGESDSARRHMRPWGNSANKVVVALEAAATREPERFSQLLENIAKESNPKYVTALLRGIARTDGIKSETLRQAILAAHSQAGNPSGQEIVEVISRNPGIAADPSVFAALVWHVEHGDARKEPSIDADIAGREILTVDNLLDSGERLRVRGINGGRGFAAEALAAVVWVIPESVEVVWKLVERRIDREPLISVRCSLASVLHSLFNHDHERCAAAIERLTLPPIDLPPGSPPPDWPLWLAPATTHDAADLFRYLKYWTPVTAERLARALVAAKDERIHLVGAWLSFLWSFYDRGEQEVADRLIHLSPRHRRLAAGVAAHALTWAEDRQRAERHLAIFFDDEDQEVRAQAERVFHYIKGEDFQRFSGLATSFVESRAMEDYAHIFLHALKEATANVSALVTRVAERIIEVRTHDSSAAGRVDSQMRGLQELLKREYASSDPVLRKRLLDLLDQMLELDIGGAQEVLQVDERD